MERFEGFDKVSEQSGKKINAVIERLKGEGFAVSETADEIVLAIKNSAGEEREMHFTKIGDKLPVGDVLYPIEDVVEAAARFPDDTLETAIRKLKENPGV